MASQDSFGRFLYPPNDITGNINTQAYSSLSDSVKVSWESYQPNATQANFSPEYSILDLAHPWNTSKYQLSTAGTFCWYIPPFCSQSDHCHLYITFRSAYTGE